MLVCNCGLSKSPLADIISGVIEACQRSLLISLRSHGNCSRQNAGIVYLRRGGRVYVKEVYVKECPLKSTPTESICDTCILNVMLPLSQYHH